MRGAPQFGHALWVGAEILCVERRLFVRLWDCFCLGTAIEAGKCSRGPEDLLAPVVADGVEPALGMQPHAQVAVGDDHALLAEQWARDHPAVAWLDDGSAAAEEHVLLLGQR